MNRDLIRAKLDSLGRCLQRVKDKRPAEPDTLRGDFDLQDILAVNLERAVRLCVDIAFHLIAETNHPIPQTMGEAFDDLAEIGVIGPELAVSLRRAVAFRNISVHAYTKLNWEIIHRLAREGVADLAEFGRMVENAMRDKQG